MQTAVIVVDYLGNVRLINDTAISLLKIPDNLRQRPGNKPVNLYEYSLELSEMFHLWQTTPDFKPKSIHISNTSSELTPRFASLGHLTASIAHELRNPLAAIRHAGELLNDSPSLEETDKRLTEIIEKQSVRVNDIIGTVLDLSRRKKAEQVNINLYNWVEDFLNEYIQLPQERFYLKFESDDLQVLFDPQHLQQIFNNLIQNALRHSAKENHHFRPVVITADIDSMKKNTYLQVMNYGSNIPEENRDKLFEPFFTT